MDASGHGAAFDATVRVDETPDDRTEVVTDQLLARLQSDVECAAERYWAHDRKISKMQAQLDAEREALSTSERAIHEAQAAFDDAVRRRDAQQAGRDAQGGGR